MTLFDQFECLKEGNLFEFKLAKGSFPKSLWETYPKFTNTAGATLFEAASRMRTHQTHR